MLNPPAKLQILPTGGKFSHPLFQLFGKSWVRLFGGILPGVEEETHFQLLGFSPHPQ